MAKDLPSPPENPALSPPVRVTGEEAVTLSPALGEPALEARICSPRGATRAVVLCHPHPLYGGTMHSAVVVAIAKVLAERSNGQVAWLRFNFRGVGASEGTYGRGVGEVLDARRAITEMTRRLPEARVTVCGYSFGTWVGLRAAAQEPAVERVALVAPAVRIFPFVKEDGRAFQGRLALFVGDRDDFCEVDEAERLATSLGARLQVFEGSDHYFLKLRRKLAEAVVRFVAPEVE